MGGSLWGRRRAYSASAAAAEQQQKDVDDINELFVEARDEIEYALEEAETVS